MQDIIQGTDSIYTIKLINHLTGLRFVISHFLISLGAVIYFRFDPIAIYTFGFLFLIDAIPAIYLHYAYYKRNKGMIFIIRNNELIYLENGKETRLSPHEIRIISLSMTPGFIKNQYFLLLALEVYHFARIELVNGKEIVFSSLYTKNVEGALKQMDGVNFEIRKKNLCSLD